MAEILSLANFVAILSRNRTIGRSRTLLVVIIIYWHIIGFASKNLMNFVSISSNNGSTGDLLALLR